MISPKIRIATEIVTNNKNVMNKCIADHRQVWRS